MTYHPLRSSSALSGVESWGAYVAETGEVYLWRASFSGAAITSIEDAQAIAKAIGENARLGLDLRGVVITETAKNTYSVDAAMTAATAIFYPPIVTPTAQDIAKRVAAALQDRLPGLVISGAHLDQMTSSNPVPPALDFWLSHPVIWHVPTDQITGPGWPMTAFAKFEGLYKGGKAEDGINLKPWPHEVPGPGPVPAGNVTDSSILWIAGGAVAIFLVYRMTQRRKAAA